MSEGGVILYPTDTIWGIGCDATNEEAVRRVYEIKQRSDSKAMLVLVDSPVKVDFYVQDVPEVAWDLIELADKPLTIIYSGARNLAPNLLAEDGSVGIRVTSEAFSKRLCQQFRKSGSFGNGRPDRHLGPDGNHGNGRRQDHRLRFAVHRVPDA